MTPPTLFLIFNRPDTTVQVFKAIQAARPTRLYVAADGPRSDRPGEAERCAEVRRIATAINWPCELHTLFREQNLGCRRAVSGAITWFFEHESEGIVLEDDTLPDPSFFRYCEALLERYRDVPKVMAICGGAYFPPRLAPHESYCFSHVFDPWGWATWRRAWQNYDHDFSTLDSVTASGQFRRFGQRLADFWMKVFNDTKEERCDSWAYRWIFTIIRDAGLVIVPNCNLISNLGFGEGATHTVDAQSGLASLPTRELMLPLLHPDTPEVNPRREAAIMKLRHGFSSCAFGEAPRRWVRTVAVGLIGSAKWERAKRKIRGISA